MFANAMNVLDRTAMSFIVLLAAAAIVSIVALAAVL